MLQERSMDLWYLRASWSDVRAVPHELSPSGLHLCVIASATVSESICYQALRHSTFHPPPMALPPWLSYSSHDPASSSAVSPATQNEWLRCQSQLVPLLSSFFCGVSQQVMAVPSQYELFSNLLRLPERTEY